MKNTLRKILETQELDWVNVSNEHFTYKFQYAKDKCIDVYISRKKTDELIMSESLKDIFEPEIIPNKGKKYIYYVMSIINCTYYIKVTKEEDIYFQSLLQNAYKKYQLKMFEIINSEMNKIEEQNNGASQKFEKELQDTINNDKE